MPETEDTTTTDETTGQTGASTRRRPPGADPEVRSFGRSRICAAEGCQTRLSRYNPDEYCSVHRGWDRQVITRKRRNDGEVHGDGPPAH